MFIAKKVGKNVFSFKRNKIRKIALWLNYFDDFLISYLIFMLSSLAVGLASQNTQAVNSWQTKSVVLNDNANVSLSQSLLTKADLKDFKKTSNDSFVGLVPIVVKEKEHQTISAQFVGLKKDEYIYKDLELVSGRKARHNNEIAVDQIMWDRGYRLGDKVTLNGSDQKYKIVGFLKNAKLISLQLLMVRWQLGENYVQWPQMLKLLGLFLKRT